MLSAARLLPPRSIWHIGTVRYAYGRVGILPTEKKRISKRSLEKRSEEKMKQSLRKPRDDLVERPKRTERPIGFQKTTRDLWKEPKKSKYSSPTIPADQEENFRYRQSPVMKIRDLALGGKAEEALAIFKSEVCKQHKERIDEFTYNQLLLACARSAKWNMGFQIYNDMKKRAVKPSIKTITNLLNCAAAVSYPNKEEQIQYTRKKVNYIIGEMEKNDIEPNTTSYNVMLKVLGSMDDLTSALRLVNEMNANPNVSVDITTYTQLVELFGKENIAGVFSVWDDMKDRGIEPNLHFYHAVMKYSNINRKPELALEVALQVTDEGISWDHRTISILCTSYALLGQTSYAGVLLRKVDELSVTMDSVLWNSLLRLGTMKAWEIAKAKWMSHVHSAQEFVDEMEKRLIASKASASTIEKSVNLLKTDEIEVLLLGSINCVLPDHAQRYYAALLRRNQNFKFSDHYQSKFNRLQHQRK